MGSSTQVVVQFGIGAPRGPSEWAYTRVMASEPCINPFQKVHQEVRAARDRTRESNRLEAERSRENAKEEAVREGFDRADLNASLT